MRETLVDALPLLVADFDADERCLYLNRTAQEWIRRCGGEPAGFTDRPLRQVLSAASYAHVEPHLATARIGQERSFDLTVDLHDGSTGTLRVTLVPQCAGDGAVQGFVATARDVTEERRLQEAVAESEQRFRVMADSSPVLLWMSGTDALCTFFNQKWLEFTGRTMEMELGTGWAEGVHPEDFQNCMDVYLSAFVARESFQMEYRMRRYDGEYRWVLDSGIPRYSPQQAFAGYIGSCIDVTDRRRGEDERKRLLDDARSARDAAQRANRLKDEFLAMLSHELRTPLTAILGWSMMLEQDLLTGGEQMRKAVTSIVRNAQTQSKLVSDILDVSRITSGQLRLDLMPCRIGDIMESALEVLRPAVAAKELRLDVEIENVPGLFVLDPARMRQVVWNLLSNATKFAATGGWLRLEAGLRDAQIFIQVEDDGPGIPEDFLPHAFERFRQADSGPARAYGGLGLGLAIVRHLVELHGGTVTATNRAEGGARLLVLLPARLADDRRASETGERPRDEPRTSLAGLRLLIVDDDLDSREVATIMLTSFGAEVAAVGSAAEAMAHIEIGRPHVVVADLEMPNEDGYSLLARLRRWPAEKGGATPAVALSAHASARDRAKSIESGYQAHLAKPVSPDDLAQVVAALATGAVTTLRREADPV